MGPRFRTVILLYMLTTFLAAVIAVVGSFLFPVTVNLKEAVAGEAPGALSDVFTNLLTNMVSNPLLSVSSANYIGILFWAIVVGLALKLKAGETTIRVVSDFSEAISQAVKWIIQFAPFGILGLVFESVSESGLEIFSEYGRLLHPSQPLPSPMALSAREWRQCLLHPLLSCKYSHQHEPVPPVGTRRGLLFRQHPPGFYH